MSTLIDHDPADNWSDILDGKNPIIAATEIAVNAPYERYKSLNEGYSRGQAQYVLSGSDLAEFTNCPKRWKDGMEDDSTASTEWGSLIDCLLMSPDELEERYAIVPPTYTTEKGEQKEWNFNATVCKEWRAQQNGKPEVSERKLADARHAADLILADEQIAEVFAASRKQVLIVGIYNDEATGLKIQVGGLLDLVPPADFLADLKTCRNAHKKAWRRQVYECGYHIQAARHLDLYNAAHGETRREFKHYIQENFKPYQTAKRILDPDFIRIGRDTYVSALKQYAQCIATGEWPDYDRKESNADIVIDGHLVTSPEAWMIG